VMAILLSTLLLSYQKNLVYSPHQGELQEV
jgi:hypothetical protein